MEIVGAQHAAASGQAFGRLRPVPMQLLNIHRAESGLGADAIATKRFGEELLHGSETKKPPGGGVFCAVC